MKHVVLRRAAARICGAVAVFCVVVLGRPSSCLAQGPELARSVRVTAENDYLDFWRPPDRRPDDNYTQGARVAADLAAAPAVVQRRFCGQRRSCGTTLELGQDMYTPTEDAVRSLPGQRPYAGWLYVRGASIAVTQHDRRSAEIILGVTGPASFAGQAQEAFHHLVHGFRRPLGWSNQLPTELDGALRAEDARYIAPSGAAHQWVDLVPAAHLTVGTLRTAVGASARARVGIGLTHPWLADPERRWWEAYLFVGGQTEAVARDLFLDGSTFHRSVHVSREPVVGAWERGVGVRLWRLGLEYRAVSQGREYRTGPAVHPFGGITLSWWLAR